MKSLLLIFLAHAALRFPWDEPWTAKVVSLLFFLLALAVVARFGGWTSLHGAWAWLRSKPGWMFLILTAPISIVALAILSGDPLPFSKLMAYAVESFFLAYALIAAILAFWVAGMNSIASWFGK